MLIPKAGGLGSEVCRRVAARRFKEQAMPNDPAPCPCCGKPLDRRPLSRRRPAECKACRFIITPPGDDEQAQAAVYVELVRDQQEWHESCVEAGRLVLARAAQAKGEDDANQT